MKLEGRRNLCERSGQESREENSELWEREKYNEMETSRGYIGDGYIGKKRSEKRRIMKGEIQ